ncbi:MAG: hypothetical protein ABR512_00590 [Desulfopila sp.]
MAKKLSPITPGDILLEEFLKPMEISQTQLARDINVPSNRINQIIKSKLPATVCSLCGNEWLSDEVAANIEHIVEEARNNHRQMEVTQYRKAA